MQKEPQDKNNIEESKDPTQTSGLPKTPAGQWQPTNKIQSGRLQQIEKPRETLMPPLNKEEVELITIDIDDQLKEEEGITEKFVEELADAYSLTDIKDRLQRFIRHLKGESSPLPILVDSGPPKPVGYPELPTVDSHGIKQTLMQWLVNNEPNPAKLQIKKRFGVLTQVQLDLFKLCYKEYGCITFEEKQLLSEEREQILACLAEGQSFFDIQQKTLVAASLVWEIKPPTEPVSTEPVSLTPPLSEEELKQLLEDVNEHLLEDKINEKFIDDLADAYSLIDLKDKLVRFIEEQFNIPNPQPGPNFIPLIIPIYPEPPKPIDYPLLPTVGSFEIKKTLIQWIVNNEANPAKLQIKKRFGVLTQDQLDLFKASYNQFKYITFTVEQMLPEERVEILVFLQEERSMDEITAQHYVHPYPVWQLYQEIDQIPVPIPVIHKIDPIPVPIPVIHKIDPIPVPIPVIHKIDPIPVPIPVIHKIDPIPLPDIVKVSLRPPLDDKEQNQVDEDIIDFIQRNLEPEDVFIDSYLLKEYPKLKNIRPQVVKYIQTFYIQPEPSPDPGPGPQNTFQWPDWATKHRVIVWLKSKGQVPNNRQCKEIGLSQDKLKFFQSLYQRKGAISFNKEDLFPEEKYVEKESMFHIFREQKTLKIVQEQTLIEVELVQQYFDEWLVQLQKDLKILFEQSSMQHDYFELIVKENYVVLGLNLEKNYKKSKEDYTKVIKVLDQYSLICENFKLDILLKLAREEDFLRNAKKQNQVKELLEYYLKHDIIIYLMVLHELWLIGEGKKESSYLEEIILQEKHQEMISAVAQLIILDSNPELKARVADEGHFIDNNNEQAEKERELDEKLKVQLRIQESKQNQQIESEQEFNKLVETIKALAIITNKKIKVHQMSDLTNCKVFNPEKETDQKTLLLVRDDINNIFHVMFQYENEKKIIDYKSSQDLQVKLPFLNNSYPDWLETFVKCTSLLRVLLQDQEAERVFQEQQEAERVLQQKQEAERVLQEKQEAERVLQQKEEAKTSLSSAQNVLQKKPETKTPNKRESVVKLLDKITIIQSEYLNLRDTNNKKRLYLVATQLLNLDQRLLQEWYRIQNQNEMMQDFCSYFSTNSARINSSWAVEQVSSFQNYFTMDALKMTLKDFNRVQMRSELNDRVNTIEKLQNQPKELTNFIINTMFGFILRKEDLSVVQSEIQSVMKGSPISLRFLIAYIIQSADMGLRSRLSYYLCQNKAVPLIMNCQETFKGSDFNKQYNQELIFSMSECEGVGVFSFGIGRMATFPCGKSEISNMIVTPKFENKSFDTNDMNVLSNGQIDVFLEKCYQKKNGWAYMDGQGQIPIKNLESILQLTNIVLIHFFEQDSTDSISVEKLRETFQLIKQNDKKTLICLILRDCAKTQEIEKKNYPKWLPMQDSVDKLIEIVDLKEVNRQDKQNEIKKVLLYFNSQVRQINQSILKEQKFTKERFLEKFCRSDDKGKQKFSRISEILQIAKDFLLEVNDLNENIFNQKGLPSLKLKDEMRAVSLKLRSFTVQEGEDQENAANRQKQLNESLESLFKTLEQLDANTLMEKFWNIVNHKDAVLIKIELSKGLINFTKNNTEKLIEKKNEILRKNGLNSNQNQKDTDTYQQIQDANQKFQNEINQIDEEIFKRSLSYEYFWRSLICVMADSKICTYWQNEVKKLKFTQTIRQQMLDGDTFELVDGRNLEMKGDIIREILGNDIECTKCIVVCVIGPQSTGKSTLMNFSFGTQFLASTGRCTQGIYFTLQKIPPEMKQGKDVEYLIILDTEGLNSPERAEPEYDRKIVMFTLLCSDFLIINSRGDMTYQMKELIKICAVRYDQLRGNAKVPKILYTFVQNSDTNPANFMAQITSLQTDVIECSTSSTVKKTAAELMTVHDDLVKVMGSAYTQQLIEKDESQGLFELTYINACSPLFGLHASDVWLEVQKLFLQNDYQFRQIGTWLSEAQDHWSLIERHGANLIEHANVTAMKNDTKMKEYFYNLWNEYLQTKVSEKDNKKAQANSQKIFESIQDGGDLNQEKNKYIKANDDEKNEKFEHMWSQFDIWKKLEEQKTLTQDLETKHKLELKKKMELLKDNFKLLLQNKVKETQMMQINNKGITDLFTKARHLMSKVKEQTSEQDKEKLIHQDFENGWSEVMSELSGLTQINQLRITSCEYLQSTFKSVNQFMRMIEPQEYLKIVAAADSEVLHENQDLPKELVKYLVNHISKNAFIYEKGQLDSKDQFKFDPQMLGLLKDPSQRIFTDKEQDKYLPLHNLFKVNYEYDIVTDMLKSISSSNFFEQIWQMLQQDKTIQQEYVSTNLYFVKFKSVREVKVDDEDQIIKSITSLFQDFGQAGFGLSQQINYKKVFKSLSNFNVETELRNYQVFNDNPTKNQWIQSLKDRIAWKQIDKIDINPRVQKILKFTNVKFENQNDPKIDFQDHYEQSKEIQTSMWYNSKPKLSYKFSIDDAGGKINVGNLMVKNNLDKMSEAYFQCLINPFKCVMAESQKWSFLANFTAILLDWEKLVLTINEQVSKEIIENKSEPKSQNENKADEEFDLRNVLERNQITLEQANRININQLQSIIKELDDELHNKLALFVHPNLSGVITWVACVIIWYKQQKNIIAKFNEQQKKLESQKETYRNNFTQIAKAVTAELTNSGARTIFIETFKIFNENCKGLLKINIERYLESKQVEEKFDTDKVYDYMDNAYISSAKATDYNKFIAYVQDPVRLFESYAESLKQILIEKLEQEQTKLYKDQVNANLYALRKRLVLIQGKIQKNQQWGESVNLFEIFKVGETIPLAYHEKKNIEQYLSPIYLSTLQPILEGTFQIGKSEFTLKVNDVATKFNFITKSKSQNEIGSPLQDLQSLQFEQDNNLDLIKILLTRLGESEKNIGMCSDLRVMIEELISLIDSKIEDIEKLTLNNICNVNQQVLELKNNAVGCRVLCTFCNRKCEHKPHSVSNNVGTPHSCAKRGHQLRVFAGGCLETSWGDRFPSLLTCDEIQANTHIKIKNANGIEEPFLWSAIQKVKNRDWVTDFTKTQGDGLNPIWVKMNEKLKDFWKELGEKFCQEKNYKYLPETQFSQNETSAMNDKSIVILCLDDSYSMFNSRKDFDKAVEGGKQVEKYLKDNHKKQKEVHVQLWYNDCHGVSQAYKGQLNGQIPPAAWVRVGCQSDKEIANKQSASFNYGECGQFSGAIRILNQEVNKLLDEDSGYKHVYWFMFTDGGSNMPHEELEALRKTFKANPKKWTNNASVSSKLIPLIVTNQLECKPLLEMSNKMNQISKEIWGKDDFCQLKQNVQCNMLAATMIEQFTLI